MNRKANRLGHCLALLLAAVLLGGCAANPAQTGSDPSAAGREGSTVSVPSSGTSVELPAPVTGTYDGKTVTMRYVAITDYIWPVDNLRPVIFANGYAPFYYYGKVPEEENLVGGSYLDKTGRMICEPLYKLVSRFDKNGRALAQRKSDGVWVYLNTDGKEIGVCDDHDREWYLFNDVDDTEKTDEEGFVDGRKAVEQSEGKFVIVDKEGTVVANLPDGLMEASVKSKNLVVCKFGKQSEDGPFGKYMMIYDTAGKPLNEIKIQKISPFVGGLAPFVSDGKLGLLGIDGTIIIPPTYPVNVHSYDVFELHENLLLLNTGGRISIVEISFVNTSSN